MSDKVVLPKFDLPGDRTPAAVKVVWGVGGVLLLCLAGLGFLVWNRHQLQLAAEKRQETIVATRLAEANAAVEAAKARAAEAAARVAAARAATEQAKIAARMPPPAAAASADGSKAGALASVRHGHHHGSAKLGSKPLAKGGAADDKKTAPKSPGEKRDDAAIDKLLASFNKK